jgi:hypothetical protein
VVGSIPLAEVVGGEVKLAYRVADSAVAYSWDRDWKDGSGTELERVLRLGPGFSIW